MGTEDEILLALDEGRGLLDQDDVPNQNQSLNCFACDAPMVGLYCHKCGNKNDNYRRSVWSLGIELFQNLTAFDGRMLRSLKSLILKPGQMSRDYSNGARQRWTSPIRFYIATSLLLFGYIAISQTQILAVGTIEEANPRSIVKVSTGADTLSPRLLFFVRKDRMIQLQDQDELDRNAENFLRGFRDATEDVDSTDGLAEAIAELDSQIEDSVIEAERRMLIQTRDSLQARLDRKEAEQAQDSSPGSQNSNADANDSQLSFTGINGQEISLNREGMNALYRMVLQHPETINTRVNNDLKLAMFFMMPFAMLMGAIFIRGRETAMLYDHLVHAAYIHSFSFILLFVFILLNQYTAAPALLLIYTIILLIYLPISAKRMFKRGWFKSFLTAYGVGAVYTLVMLLVFFLIVVLALQELAFDLSEQQARFGNSSTPTSVPFETPATPDVVPPTDP
ncbi:DUF3667 domain-containing protein [Algimonas porphyrae]|nr:DUF3667 domain-containing protein [Algimonas porphyrae]